jgi:hypothetical protein
MKAIVVPVVIVLFLIVDLGRVEAQSINPLRIVISAGLGRADDRGDRVSTRIPFDAAKIGETRAMTISRLAGQCGLGSGAASDADTGEAFDGSIKKRFAAWTVRVTPLKRAGEAVTFRLQWTRSRENGRPSTTGEDGEVTLRPGQSLSVDVMSQSQDTVQPPNPPGCVLKTMFLRVGVEHDPEPDRDRRLLAVELWLVERLPDGKERSQPLSLRGLYHHAIPFYFDTLTDGGEKSLEIFGDLQVSPGERTTAITITTRSRMTTTSKASMIPPGVPDLTPSHRQELEALLRTSVDSATATLEVAPGEVVTVPLAAIRSPRIDPSAFNARALSYRIRVRQIR